MAFGRMGHNDLDRETAFLVLVWSAEANGVYIDEPEQCERTINGGLDDGLNGEPWRVENQSKDYKSISRQPVSIKNLMIDAFDKLYPDQAIRFNSRLERWEIGTQVLSANNFLLKFAESINYTALSRFMRYNNSN